ncbi:MAG TPA: 3-keto-5-aminohexanoate cleavage protein [Actinoplanes sp.]
MLQVTPTGPWDTDVHPNMPVAPDELLADLRECFRAGAGGVHLHVRDGSGAETLDPAVVNERCRQVREIAADVGVSAEIGLTTGEWIVPDLASRAAMIGEWEGVDCATVNLSERGFERVMQVMLDVGIGIDVGLWAPAEMDALVASGFLPRVQRVSIELAPGEPYHLDGEPAVLAQQVNDALDAAGSDCPRLTHGMNDWTWPLVADAFRRGHDTRVGFEDSVYLPDGSKAQNNAHLVRAARELQDAIAADRRA